MNVLHGMIGLAIACVVIIGNRVHAQTLIGPSDGNLAVLNGTTHTLTCRRGPDATTGSIAWDEAIGDGRRATLFINEGRESLDAKYNNFAIDPDNLYDLVITDMVIEDEGTYICRYPAFSEEITAIRTVEVRSSYLQMTQDGSDTSPVTMRAGEPLDMVCTVVGARPTVEVWWYDQKPGGSEQRVTTGVTQTNTSNPDGTFDSISTLQYTATKDYNGGSLRCETTGQQVAQSRQDSASLNVQCATTPEPSTPTISATTKRLGSPNLLEKNGGQGQDLIGPSPEFQAVLMGHNHNLTCSRTPGGQSGWIAWYEDVPGGTAALIFLGSMKGSGSAKYDNFAIDSDDIDRFDLVITNIEIEDEGTYYCQHTHTGEAIFATRVVEVYSSFLQMTQDVSDVTTVTVTEGIPSDVVCTALGTRPVVEIRWYQQKDGGSEVMIDTDVSHVNTSNGDGTFDTVSILQYTASKDYNGGQLRCETTGQQVAQSREESASLNVQYAPLPAVPDPVTGGKIYHNPVLQHGPRRYMELDTHTFDKEQVYQALQFQPLGAQSPTYEDIAEDTSSKDRVNQELGNNPK